MDLLSSIVKSASEMIQTIVDDDPLPSASTRLSSEARKCGIDEDTFDFVKDLIQDRTYAKKLFISYSNVLIRDKKVNFKMTKEQNCHARGIIQALPNFNQLRFELCPSSMQDDRFWCVYFNLLKDKSCIGVSKEPFNDHEEVDVGEALGTFRVDLSEAKEDIVTEEDICKGLKREREDDSAQTEFSEDLAVVSRMFYSGACKTLQYAEQLIETVDLHASNTIAPMTPKNLNILDTKRGRFDRPKSVEEEGLIPDSETPNETDSFSVSTADDNDLKDWTRVRAVSSDDESSDRLEFEGYEII